MNTGMLKRRLFLGIIVPLVCLVAGALVPQSAFARISSCRTDPIIVLTNLQTIDVGATINDDGADVRGVLYVVHVPVGTSPVLSISYTLGFAGREAFVVRADNPPGKYDTYTMVVTGKSGITVQSFASVGFLPTLGTHYANGVSHQMIHIGLSPFLGLGLPL